jgi:hypothetical protein
MSKLIQKAKKCFSKCTASNNSTLYTNETTFSFEQEQARTATHQSPIQVNAANKISTIQTTPIKINRQFNLKKQTAKINLQNEFEFTIHQTQIDEFPMLICTPEKPARVLSSTVIYNDELSIQTSPCWTQIEEQPEISEFITPKAFVNVLYESPDSTRTQLIDTTFCQMESRGFDSSDFVTAHSFMFIPAKSSVESVTDTEIYACCVSHEAMSPNELSVEFADRLRLIQSSDNQYCLVQNIHTSVYGFVPKYCILPMSIFLKDVQIMGGF